MVVAPGPVAWTALVVSLWSAWRSEPPHQPIEEGEKLGSQEASRVRCLAAKGLRRSRAEGPIGPTKLVLMLIHLVFVVIIVFNNSFVHFLHPG